jgi:hypothetical protein
MKSISLLVTLFVFFVFVASPALAYPLEIEILNNNQDVVMGSMVNYEIVLTNNRNIVDPVRISVKDTHYEWLQNSYTLLNLEPESSETIEIGIAPTGDKEGLFEFDVSMWSYDKPWIKVEDTIYINVNLKFDIEDLYTKTVGDNLNIYLVLDSSDERETDVSMSIKDSFGNVIKTFTESLILHGLKTIEKTVHVSEFLAGEYMIEVSVEGTDMTKTLAFEIEPVHAVAEIVKKISTPLYEDVVITIENNGNLIERDYTTYQTLPNNDWITGMVTEPVGCDAEGEEKVCGYVVQELMPGASAMITYRLNYWVIYSEYAIIVLIIISIITFSFIRVTSPSIAKRHARKSEGKHSIILEIKNPFRHHLSNVIVRDWISPLAKVLHEEFEMLVPVIRRSDAGTEMIWKLGDMRPKETRIITYKIKTLVQGSLKMPRAYIRFTNKKGSKTRVFSKHLIVE